MALPSSAPISFSQVRTEFSSIGTSANFSAYVRGGAIVPNHGNTANIPTSSAGMKLSDFYGADVDSPAGLVNPTPDGSKTDYETSPTDAVALIVPTTDGYITGSSAYYSPPGAGVGTGKYWKWTLVSGTAPNLGVAAGSWVAVNGSNSVGQTVTGTGTRSCVVAISFANDSGGSGATTAGNWTIEAGVEA